MMVMEVEGASFYDIQAPFFTVSGAGWSARVETFSGAVRWEGEVSPKLRYFGENVVKEFLRVRHEAVGQCPGALYVDLIEYGPNESTFHLWDARGDMQEVTVATMLGQYVDIAVQNHVQLRLQ
jgi:hypothetical protein